MVLDFCHAAPVSGKQNHDWGKACRSVGILYNPYRMFQILFSLRYIIDLRAILAEAQVKIAKGEAESLILRGPPAT